MIKTKKQRKHLSNRSGSIKLAIARKIEGSRVRGLHQRSWEQLGELFESNNIDKRQEGNQEKSQ